MPNPYKLADINILIDAYTSPQEPQGAWEAYQEGVAAGREYLIEDIGGAWGGLDFVSNAIQDLKLQEKMDIVKGAIDTLYGYGTFAQDKKWEGDIPGVQGIDMQNTWYTMLDADNAGEAAMTLVADCVPCADRILALLSLNPLEDLWSAFDQIYKSAVSSILSMYDLLLGDKSAEVLSDFCSLFQFLNFMCVPDLVRIVTMFTKLIAKYAMSLKDMKMGLMGLLGMISGPSLAPLLSLFDKYYQLVMAPMECVLDSLDAHLQKINVGKSETLDIDTKEISKSIGGALLSLRDNIKKAQDVADAEFKKIKREIADFLDVQDEADKQMFDVQAQMQTLLRHIGLIQAIIQAAAQGAIVCGPETNGEEDLEIFVTNYVSAQFDLDIVVQDDEITMSPSAPEDIKELLTVLATLEKQPALDSPPVTVSEPLPIVQAVVPVRNCLYAVRDFELDRVKDFLSTNL